MTVLAFSMSGTPKPKGRPRATTRGGFASIYTPAETRKYEAAVREVGRLKMAGAKPLFGALSVSLRFRFEPAKSLSKKARAALLSGETAYDFGPDVDNLAKAILDGLQSSKKHGPGVFEDDRRIVRLFVTKVAHERAGVDVRIEALSPQEIAA